MPPGKVISPHPPHRHSGVKRQPITRDETDAGSKGFFHSEELLRRSTFEVGIVAICDFYRGLEDIAAGWVEGVKLGNVWGNVGGREGNFAVAGFLGWQFQDFMEEERCVLVVEFVARDYVLGAVSRI
jgi:hypothetical protein